MRALVRRPMRRILFEPTPHEIVEAMLWLAGVDEDDVVYDLGSGDGRIVITAALSRGARGVGIEADAELVRAAREAAWAAGVSHKVSFVRENLFAADVAGATVVTLFLLPEANLLLRERLLETLQPGTRIVSHSHDMGDWQPLQTLEVPRRRGWPRQVHLWVVPQCTPRDQVPDRAPPPRRGAVRALRERG